jgi:hypothetical protein
VGVANGSGDERLLKIMAGEGGTTVIDQPGKNRRKVDE